MDTFEIGPKDVALSSKRSWRRHSTEFKARVVELAQQPGASMAAVALANGLNANMLRRWVHEAAGPPSVPPPASFVQLPMGEPRSHAVPEACPVQTSIPAVVARQHVQITVEIYRGGATVHAKLPMDDRSAAWLREVLG